MIPRPKLGDDSIYTLGQGILPKNDCGRLRPHLSRAFHYGLRHPHKPLCSLFHASSRHLITTLNHINYNTYNHCTMQMFNFFLTCNHYLKPLFKTRIWVVTCRNYFLSLLTFTLKYHESRLQNFIHGICQIFIYFLFFIL